MSGTRPAGSFWPSALQERLLAAALADPQTATVEWRSLPPTFDLDRLEAGSFETLPLIYRNLTAAGYEDADQGRLKGIYRRAWLKNQLLLQRTSATVQSLSAAGIRSLVIEGPTVAARYYGELGLRPTSFVHLLVDRTHVDAARGLVQEVGWVDQSGDDRRPGTPQFFSDPDGHIGVLRSSIASDLAADGDLVAAHEPFWAAAETQTIEEIELPVPAPTDLLFAICVAGARRAAAPNVQWVLDAAMILRRSSPIDSARLLALAEGGGQQLRVRDAFSYLATLPDTEPPADVLSALRASNQPRRRRIAHSLASGAAKGAGTSGDLLAEYLTSTAHRSPLVAATMLPGFLKRRWSVATNRQLPIAIARRAVRAVTERPHRAA